MFVDRPPRFIDADAVVSRQRRRRAGRGRAPARRTATAASRFLGDRPSVFTAAERRRRLPRGARRRPASRRTRRSSASGSSASDAPRRAAARAARARPTRRPRCSPAQNLITIGAVRALRALGLQHEVALVGFDDVDARRHASTRASPSCSQDPYELGRRAGGAAVRAAAGAGGPSELVVLPTELIARGSGEIAPETR